MEYVKSKYLDTYGEDMPEDDLKVLMEDLRWMFEA